MWCNNLISLFGVPKDQALFEEWAKVIPIKRKPLNPKSLVCQLHFEETCIKNSNKKKNRRLKTGSIPTLRFTRKQLINGGFDKLLKNKKNFQIFFRWIKSTTEEHWKSSEHASSLLDTWWIDSTKAEKYKQCHWRKWTVEFGSIESAGAFLAICETSEWTTASSHHMLWNCSHQLGSCNQENCTH